MPVPYDIYALRTVKIAPTPSQEASEPSLKTQSETDIQGIVRELRRVALANGYGKIIQARALNITTTPLLLKEHLGSDDRLLRIFNWDIVGGNSLFVDIDSQVSMGFPIRSGEAFSLVVVPNDRIWIKSSAGTVDTRVLEITNYPQSI